MEKVPSKGAIQSGKNAVQGTVAVPYEKGAICLKKVPLTIKNIIQCRVCRKGEKNAIQGRKTPSKEEMLFNMDKVPSVSEK